MAVWVALCLCTLSFPISALLCGTGSDYWKNLDGPLLAMSLFFNTLSRFFFLLFIAFLPRSKSLLISWLQSPSAVILEPKKIKSVMVSPSICHEAMGPDDMIFVF